MARSNPYSTMKANMQPQEKREPNVHCVEERTPVVPSPSAPTHSQPVVIPPRTPTRNPVSTQTVRVRGQNGERNTRTPANHQRDAIPPAVAALLAVTEIPRMPSRRRNGSAKHRRISMDELIQEWNREESELSPAAMASPSPLDVLLGRVDESEDEYGSLASTENERESMTSRSVSSESISTMPPSLDLDSPSFVSAASWDNLSTPESSYSRPERREKAVQSPPKEDCVFDHPLLHYNQDDCDDIAELDMSDLVDTSPSPLTGRFKSFKSNLTASFAAMKSAAKSFSNFTAPSVPPEDLLTRSLLSPLFASEMRPKDMEGLPSPALRRYLNPQPSAISPAELSMQLHASLLLDDDINPNAPMIQMQTYDRRARSNRRRKNDPFSEAGRALNTSPSVRQREPRENSDFLRVIVLEMNMRRVGKLDAKAVGKARIWLPPRQSTASSPPSSHRSQTPARWISTPADVD